MGPEMVRSNTMTHISNARVRAGATVVTLSGLILAMGAPVKWCIVVWPW
jgi:hypothetical protein